MTIVRIVPTQQGYALYSPKSFQFLQDFKRRILARNRAFCGSSKCWYVAPGERAALADLVQRHFGVQLDIPVLNIPGPPVITRTFQVDYLGQCKVRDDGTVSSMGTSEGDWQCVLPEDVLRAWFNQGGGQSGAGEAENAPQSLYATLGVPVDVPQGELKSAYRRLARQWHPDVCREPNAQEMFQRLDMAYKRLSDPLMRRKYDAGLAMEAATSATMRRDEGYGFGMSISGSYGWAVNYQPPLRCGIVTGEWSAWLGRYTARRIDRWDDITDGQGRVAVASWQKGADRYTVQWVTP